MPDSLDLVHVSGGLIGTSLIAEALSDSPRRSQFAPASFRFSDGEAPTPTGITETIETAWQLACELYDEVASSLDDLNISGLRERWLLPFLELLDFDPVFQRSRLPSEDGRDRFAISHLAWSGEAAPPLHLVSGDLDTAGHGQRSPHDELQLYLNRSTARWGIVANGRRLRLLRDFHHQRLKAFVGIDLDAVFETRNFPGFRALYRVAHRSRFGDGSGGPSPLESLFDASQQEGVQIGLALQTQVRSAIEALAEGLLTSDQRTRIASDPTEARALYLELLRILYRLLFLLFAEQRRMLPADGLYAETYSLAMLARLAETKAADLHRHDLWEGLKVTFRMLSEGAPALGVFPYNGQLFDPARTSQLMAARCENLFLLDAVRALTHVRVGGIRQRVNYSELGVEELGSVYESLLNEIPRIAEQPTPHPLEPRIIIPKGGVYLTPLGTERNDLGAYYTPPTLVDFALSVSIDPLIAERLETAGTPQEAREQAILDLRICDPACGSGAFLVGAIDRVATALATERAHGAKPTEEALRLARRDVLRTCIYGVDKDAFGVELCKVALWIHCAVPDLPLSFLDHRIQHGDSLVGWPLIGIPSTIPLEAYKVPSKIAQSNRPEDRKLRTFLREAGDRNRAWHEGQGVLGHELPRLPDIHVDFPALMAEDERIPADVARKSEAYDGYLQSDAFRQFTIAADLWTGAFFWGPGAGAESPTGGSYVNAMEGESAPEQARAAAEILDEFPVFHWPLRFPEIRARGGFDAFVGNPPWEQFENREQEWFTTRAPWLAALRGEERKQALRALDEKDPELARRWHIYEQINQRIAEYARNCDRFMSPGGKANTYLFFTEMVSRFLRRNGRAGIIVKSALALDKSASGLFRHLIEMGQLIEFHDHVNGGQKGSTPIFPAVAAVERFAVIALSGHRNHQASFDATVMNWSLAEGISRPRQNVTPGILATINPRTRTLTSFRHIDQFEVALDVHRRLPILDFEDGGENPWRLSYHTLFNSTTASGHFRKREKLEAEEWLLGADKVFRRPRADLSQNALRRQEAFEFPTSLQSEIATESGDAIDVALPLYEGQMVRRYDHRARTYEGYNGSNKYGKKPAIPVTTDAQKANPGFEIEPRYWIEGRTVGERLEVTVADQVAIGFRNVGAPWTNSRTIRGAFLPRYPATDALPIFALLNESAFEFIGIMNSTLFDFLVRGHMSGANAKLSWMLSQIPVPSPGLDPTIADRAERLSLTSHCVAQLFGQKPYAWDSDERYRLDIELDALIAHAYRVTESQYATILDSFEVMAREQQKVYGRYKFKGDCLAAYRRVG